MRTLGIDTSNYATSLAVFDTNAGEVVCDCKRFLPVPGGSTGPAPERCAVPPYRRPAGNAGRTGQKGEPDADRSCRRIRQAPPVDGSYMPCFLAGVSAATAFCAAKGIPLVQTTHQQGHISAALFAASGADLFGKEELVFHVSGGTTDLLHCKGPDSITCIGTSSDLYAGQAVDRLGVRLGYAFPAGIYVSQLAAACTENIKPKVSVRGTTCSLSGLQNQCEKLLAEGKSPEYVSKYCLLCVAETLRRMAAAALERNPGLPVVFAGGVMSSEIVRDYITKRMQYAYFVPGKFASDNAIGVSILAAREINAWPNTSM